ncbi:STAS domain-containing protein [Castellaniella sp.]|uniref:STAS domain-containing protein n=1 Tax=Castellaniella sp. TaxID=1955812 RepID=UPI00355EBEBB
MNILSERNGAVRIISVIGQINGGNAVEAETRMLAQLQHDDADCVLDLAEVDYISSAGLRVVLMLAKHQKQHASRLVLCRLQPHVHEVFDISGFLSILSVVPDRTAALAWIAGAADQP